MEEEEEEIVLPNKVSIQIYTSDGKIKTINYIHPLSIRDLCSTALSNSSNEVSRTTLRGYVSSMCIDCGKYSNERCYTEACRYTERHVICEECASLPHPLLHHRFI